MQKTALSYLSDDQTDTNLDEMFNDQWQSRYMKTAELAKKFLNAEATKKLYEAYKKNQPAPEGGG